MSAAAPSAAASVHGRHRDPSMTISCGAPSPAHSTASPASRSDAANAEDRTRWPSPAPGSASAAIATTAPSPLLTSAAILREPELSRTPADDAEAGIPAFVEQFPDGLQLTLPVVG